jgi:DNA helicase-2/ATP-dependent DNA helicase PcrA
VGITRAQQRLFLSRAQVRTSWGQPSYNPPSRFLDELPADTVHWSRLEAAPASTGFGSAQARVAATGLSTGGLRGGAGNRAVISVDVGDRVSHDAFGLGTVVEVTGAGDKAQATVDFGSGGTKRLVLRYAPLVKL